MPMNDVSSAAAEISRKQESLISSAQSSNRTNTDLLTEITDTFQLEHAAQRAAIETRYAGGSALAPSLMGDGTPAAQVVDAAPEYQEVIEGEFEERRTGHRNVPVAMGKEFNKAASQLYKKHEALRVSNTVVETKGGNKTMMADINDEFLKEHLEARAAVDVDTMEVQQNTVPVAGPPLNKTSLVLKSAAPTAVAPPRIMRHSLGAPVVDREMNKAAGALASRHEELRSNLSKPSHGSGANQDLLSEVTDQFLKDHMAQRSAVDMQAILSAPPSPSPVYQAATPGSGLRRASMGSMPLATVPEKKVKEGFLKKLGRLLTGDTAPRMAPKLAQQSAQVSGAVTDIGSKSRQLTRSSMTAVSSTGGSGTATPTQFTKQSSGADMLGTLCDEWHTRNENMTSSLNTNSSAAMAAAALQTSKLRSAEHAPLEL